ncbi:7115_t:CDS:2, partial [Acaulospora morrowiae]
MELLVGEEFLFHLTPFTSDVLAVADLGIHICEYNKASILFAILAWLAMDNSIKDVTLSLHCCKAPRVEAISISARANSEEVFALSLLVSNLFAIDR